MIGCYEIYRLTRVIRSKDHKTEESFTGLPDDAEEAFIKLLRNYNKETFGFFNTLDNYFRTEGWPYAMVAFTDEYKLAGHLMSIREHKEDFFFTGLSLEYGSSYNPYELGPPPVSFVCFKTRSAFLKASEKSKLFEYAKTALRGKPESHHFLIISENPDPTWEASTSKNDDELFFTLLS